MKKRPLFSLFFLLVFASLACNKEVDQISVPPFTVFPNPFIEDFTVHLENIPPTNEPISIRILDGKNQPIAVWEDPVPGSFFRVNMNGYKKALYYAELSVGSELFVLPVIKAK